MAKVIYAARALAYLERALENLRENDPEAAMTAAGAIRSAVEGLAAHPLLGRRIRGELRELAISYGPTGYLALYRFRVPQDEVRILALRQQRDIGFVP